jgi:hypothetical protein
LKTKSPGDDENPTGLNALKIAFSAGGVFFMGKWNVHGWPESQTPPGFTLNYVILAQAHCCPE